MSDETPREADDELDVEEEAADPTWLPQPDRSLPVEADAADWLDQQRAVPEDDETGIAETEG
ncbi:MAG: hypothetical protein HZB15_13280 [Actinobacteria bacterium]|nr:hypothetical protein [Actinomycetota bacterium]